MMPHVVPHLWPNCPKYLSKDLPKPRDNAATLDVRAKNELCDGENRESIIAENNKIRSLPELIDKMKGQVPNGVHMIIDERALSFVSLKFHVVTKKLNIVCECDLKFHISCTDCTAQPQEI